MSSICRQMATFFLAVAILGLFGRPVQAQVVLYGATGVFGPFGTTSRLYTLNQTTGAATEVGPLVDSGGVNYALSGLAYNAATDTLFGSTVTSAQSPTARQLVTINRSTGLVTPIGPFNIDAGTGGSMSDLSFQPSTGTLFGWAPLVGALFTINLSTGQATQVGSRDPNVVGGGALAFRPDGTLFSAPDADGLDQLRTVDPVTGVHTVVTTINGMGADFINAMAFNGSTAFINLSPNQTAINSLGTLNTATGLVTYLGPNVARMDALEFVPIPEPTSLALVGVSLIAGWRLRRRVQVQRASQ